MERPDVTLDLTLDLAHLNAVNAENICPNCARTRDMLSTTLTTARNDECSAMYVDSSMWLTELKLSTTERIVSKAGRELSSAARRNSG